MTDTQTTAPAAAGLALDDRYSSGDYVEKNPTFHVERADFKAGHVLKMLAKHGVRPQSVGDIGCGAGEILRLLSEKLPEAERLEGYELSPQGYEMCLSRATDRLRFFNENLFETDRQYDLMLCMDVFEHVEDPWSFLRSLRPHGRRFAFHIPLDMTAFKVLRGGVLLRMREKLGHIHYYTKGTACALLGECGYRVVDTAYTPSGIHKRTRWTQQVMKAPRVLLHAVAPDFAARAIGGYSLLVLAEPADA